jgi:hypothetical protein
MRETLPPTDPGNDTRDDKHTFSSGASSSGMKPRYDLIPSWALERIAKRFAEGAKKYGENNWQKGVTDKEFIIDRMNHMVEHLYKKIEAVRAGEINPDDDMAAVILNAIFVMGHERATSTQPDEIPF